MHVELLNAAVAVDGRLYDFIGDLPKNEKLPNFVRHYIQEKESDFAKGALILSSDNVTGKDYVKRYAMLKINVQNQEIPLDITLINPDHLAQS
jgi:hypothetical protein